MRFYVCVEISQRDSLSIHLYSRRPFAHDFMPVSPLQFAGRFARKLTAIGIALRTSTRPKILTSIVKAIPILVVIVWRIWKTSPACNLPVHQERHSVWSNGTPSCVPQNTVCFLGFLSLPLKLHRPFKIFRRDDSELGLRERNQTRSLFKHSSFSSAGLFIRRLRCFFMEQTPNLCQR